MKKTRTRGKVRNASRAHFSTNWGGTMANSCSEARVTKRVRRRPGASPLLFGRFLMSLGAFISLEDISEALPPYREEVVSVEMDPP
jgi:hypothetical protein